MEPIVLVAIITGGLSVLGQFVISRSASNKAQAITELRLDVIEAKLDKHNCFMERIAVLEVKSKNIESAIEDLKHEWGDVVDKSKNKYIIRWKFHFY